MKEEEIVDWKTRKDGVHLPIGENGEILFDDNTKKKAKTELVDRLKKVIIKKQKAYSDAMQKIADLVQRFRN